MAKGATIRRKAPQSLDCGTVQDGTLRRGLQSAALLVGESGAHATKFSSAAAARLLHSF